VIEPINAFGVTSLFGSPALLDRVGRWAEQRDVKLPSLKRVISAGAPVSPKVIERFTKLLSQGVEVFTPYGATESLPVASIGSDEILGQTAAQTAQGQGVCVGRPVEPATVRIIGISDEAVPAWSDDLALPAGDIGEVVVQGPAVTEAYDGRPEATALAKIPSDGGTWHRMGDLGYFDPQGRLWFCGRKSHRVVSEDGERYTTPCEGVFNAHPRVKRSALVGVGGRPVICVELETGASRAERSDIEGQLRQLAEAHEHTRSVHAFLFHPGFPVDIRHNAKIRREVLAEWAAARLAKIT
jgi:acyl-CoA synthetase (AMP-forming)/AMP-acid ligase II